MSAIPEMFAWDGPVRKHPLIQPEKFHLWIQQDRSDRVPFPLLPMPSPEEMRALLDAVGWDERQASVRFQAHVYVIRQWLNGTGTPTDGTIEFTRLGAQAGWSALAYVTGLPPAAPKKTRSKKAVA